MVNSFRIVSMHLWKHTVELKSSKVNVCTPCAVDCGVFDKTGKRFICLPLCVITPHGKFSCSIPATLFPETLSITRFNVFASLVFLSPIPSTSAAWKWSTHPFLFSLSHIEHKTGSSSVYPLVRKSEGPGNVKPTCGI